MTNFPHARVSSMRRRRSFRPRVESGRFLCRSNRLLRKLRYVLRGFDAGRLPPPRWYTTAEGTAMIFAPDRSMRQHRSISSICAKKSVSSPPAFLYSSVRTIRAAPVAQNISIGVSYWPWSASTCENMRPRQYGYPFLSMNPPEAPAYSKCVLSL